MNSVETILITPAGAERLRKELEDLRTVERPQIVETVAWAAANGDRSENADYHYGKRKLRQIDSRIHFLSKRLDNIEVVDPLKITAEDIRFGATVTLEYLDQSKKTYTIVGIDEGNIEKGRISWQSPLAKALFKKKQGDFVVYKAPSGEVEVEVLEVKYLEIKD
ncbi:MAG: transcription elongation factor GreB [Bdellovibrionales bacterium]|nr:transcription elongation factor GreB [Bdellovibrionales bacterium]